MPHPDPCPTCQRISDAHARGVTGRNDLAKVLSVALATVTNHAKHCGISFDRRATAAAVEAHRIDNKARRLRLIADLYDIADQDAALLKAPNYTYRVVFKDDSEVVADSHAPSGDRRNHVQAISVAMTTAARLEAIDGDPTISKAASTLVRLADAFGINDA